MNKRLINIFIALGVAVLCWVLFIILFNNSTETIKRIAIALGGDLTGGGYIQFIIYIAFFWGMLEIIQRLREIKQEEEPYQYRILIEDEHKVMLPDDVMKLRLEVIELEQEKQKYYLMTDLIKKICTKFRANKSIAECMEVLSRQASLNYQEADSSQSIIRYIAWVIPSIGFIGTVLGIAGGISAVGGNVDEKAIEQVTSLLGLAFDTTLISLILSVVLMYLIHDLQEKEEKLHNKMEQYITNNLVNRIYVN